ncbi:FAD-binding domain [Actinoplanes sp. KI2]|uniref:FAD-binding domain n=1 Tax=Actinoplanes sp. KI2 TaxID=2983315 RepID=UPI0021D5C8F7|nr:FAD-binding domain [Actinoplanes sp. KI2]MCU7730983.1 FAD-binding domain [Actinoplanes sp. KI2]
MRVLIVGAGIAGPTLAYWLLRSGHHVTLVEQAPELRRGGYLIDFSGAGFDVADRMGIVPELRRRGYVLDEARAVDRDGRRIAAIKPAAIMGSMQRYVSIARSDLAAVIFEALEDAAELMLGDSVRTLVDDGNQVRVTFDSGQDRTFDLVVGADGLHSRVRRMIFGPDVQFEKYLDMVVAAFEVRGYRPRDELTALMHADVGFQALRLSLRDDVTLCLLTVAHRGSAPIGNRATQHELLRTALAGAGWETPALLELMPEATTFYFDAVSQIRMPSWARGRVALVGDAAAGPSFLAGQGSALAMVESYTLAAELARCSDHRDAFARYQQRLAPFLRSKQDAAIGLAPAFAPKTRLQLLLRNTVMRLMGLPKVPDLVMGRSFRDAVELPTFAAS